MINPLSPEDEARLPSDLLRALREGNTVALVGAGLSRSLGFPSWIELLRKLAAATLQNVQGDTEAHEKILAKASALPEWVGEVLKHHSPDAYNTTLRRLFSTYAAPRFSLNHALLAALPFRGYLTTNYDHLVEDYVEHLDEDSPYVATPFQEENPSAFMREQSRFVLKIHGCAARDAGKLVLASSEYFELVRDQRYERMLAYLFQRYSIVTLGFGLADRDLTRFIEERRHLYGNKCPPIYALVPANETTNWEVDVYRKLYNVTIVPVDPANGFQQLTSILLSLYCLTHSTDSRAAGHEICDLAHARYCQATFVSSVLPAPLPKGLEDVLQYLSVFRDPIPMSRFSSWLAAERYNYTSAHYRFLGQLNVDGRLSLRHHREVDEEKKKRVGLWLRNEFEGLSKEMTAFDKQILETYSNTITALLSTADGAAALLNYNRSTTLFDKLSQFYKQTGRWISWLKILRQLADQCSSFTLPKDELDLLVESVNLDIIWVLLWQRYYDEALRVFAANPDLKNTDKGRMYLLRIRHHTAKTATELDSIIDDIDKIGNGRSDELSLLGRLHARRAQLDFSDKQARLRRALDLFRRAYDEATVSGKILDTSVQSYYIACVEADLGNVTEAQKSLAEIQRIDGAILNRVPGKAWQLIAEYRVELAQNSPSSSVAASMRKRASQSLEDLGINAPEDVLDREYY